MSSPGRAPDICVAVATRRRPHRLSRLLDSLAAQTLSPDRFEVNVAIDRPDPETEALLDERARSFPATLRKVVRPPGSGAGAARNVAWRAGSAPLVAFTDDDCEAAPAWLEAVLAAADARPGAVLQGPTSPNPRESGVRGPYARTQRIEAPNHWYQTCNITYPRALLEHLEGFDERFSSEGEDVDLGWRARGAGAQIEWVPQAQIWHAVEEIGLRGYLRLARRGGDSALVYRRHPELRRRTAFAGVFWKRTHAWFALAVSGLLLARRARIAFVLLLPYLKGLRGRARLRGGSPVAMAPGLILCDLADIAASVRGSARHRVLML